MNKLIQLAAIAALLTISGCTKSNLTKIVDAAGQICEVVLQEKDPAAEPFCAKADEVADAIIALSNLPAAKPGAAAPAPITEAALKAKIVEMRAAKASKPAASK